MELGLKEVMKITWDGWNFHQRPSALEKRVKAKKNWPPAESEKWTPKVHRTLFLEFEFRKSYKKEQTRRQSVSKSHTFGHSLTPVLGTLSTRRREIGAEAAEVAADALGQPDAPIGSEEWYWLGPDPKRCDGQHNL